MVGVSRRLLVFVCIIAVIVVGILVFSLVYFEQTISIQSTGVMGRLGDVDYSEFVNISIEGIYSRSVIRQDIFRGEFKIESFNFTSDGSIITLFADENFGATMKYINLDGLKAGSDVIVNNLGLVFFTPDFAEFTILIFEPGTNSFTQSWCKETGMFLSAPSSDRKEALDMMRELLSESIMFDDISFR